MSLDNGYEYIYLPDCPLAKQNGTVYTHRLVASLKVGYWLSSEDHIHHIDGNKLNNNPENLIILTSSEHARLEQEIRGNSTRKDSFCISCNKKLSGETKTNLCEICYHKTLRLFDPSKEELEKLVWEMSTIKVAKLFNVSDKAIEKRCKLLNIPKPPRGYWNKKYAGKL